MALHIACFGEVLMRLSTPDHLLLDQATQLDVHIGGAEANVAVALARTAGSRLHQTQHRR